MLEGKRYLLAILVMAVILVPLSLLIENFNADTDIKTVARQELISELANPKTPLYIEVLSRNCNSGDCNENDKVVRELAADYRGKIKFLRVYVEEVPDAGDILGVHSTPSGVLVVPSSANVQTMGAGAANGNYSPVEGFGSRLRLKQLFDSVTP